MPFEEFWRDLITINRRTKTSTNSLGEPVYTEAAVYTSVKARVEQDSSKMEYNASGQRKPFDFIIVYVKRETTALEQDKVFHNGTLIGKVRGINKALGPGNSWSHNELILERP